MKTHMINSEIRARVALLNAKSQAHSQTTLDSWQQTPWHTRSRLI